MEMLEGGSSRQRSSSCKRFRRSLHCSTASSRILITSAGGSKGRPRGYPFSVLSSLGFQSFSFSISCVAPKHRLHSPRSFIPKRVALQFLHGYSFVEDSLTLRLRLCIAWILSRGFDGP